MGSFGPNTYRCPVRRLLDNTPSNAVFQYNTGPYFFACCTTDVVPGYGNFTNADGSQPVMFGQ